MNEQEFQKHHLPKPCMFCPNMAGYAPLEEMEKHAIGVYYCHTCMAEYLFFRDDSYASISLYKEINGKMYRWTVTSVGEGMLWHVKKPGVPGVKRNEDLVPIKAFEAPAPQLTPSNMTDKIKTWLLFL